MTLSEAVASIFMFNILQTCLMMPIMVDKTINLKSLKLQAKVLLSKIVLKTIIVQLLSLFLVKSTNLLKKSISHLLPNQHISSSNSLISPMLL